MHTTTPLLLFNLSSPKDVCMYTYTGVYMDKQLLTVVLSQRHEPGQK